MDYHVEKMYTYLRGFLVGANMEQGRQMTRQMQSKFTVAKSTRRYNNLDRSLPGTVFLYEGRQYVMTGQLSGGMYLRACGTGKQNYPV